MFTLKLGPNGSQPVSSNALTFAFTNVVQTCKFKTKIDKATKTTIDTTNCILSVEFIVTNPGTLTSAPFTASLWADQGSTFQAAYPLPAREKVKSIKGSKSVILKAKGTFGYSLSGTFIYATDTNLNVLASIPVE